MGVPWTARRSNQSILQEISPGISVAGRMLKLKLQYVGHLMQRVDSLEKSYDQRKQHIKKQRHYFADKVHLVKAIVFPVVMYGCKSWTTKKAEHRRIDASELWCWRRLLGVPWSARRSNQAILKEISPGCSLQGLMLRLKLQYLAT